MTYGTVFQVSPPTLAPAPTKPPPGPAEDSPGTRSTIYLPSVSGGKPKPVDPVRPTTYPAGMNKMAWAFAELWMNHPLQERVNMQPHELLVAAARYRIEVMMAENHLNHVSLTGETANEVVERYYGLPFWFDKIGNNVESLAGGQQTAAGLMQIIENSDTGHRAHILGTVEGFAVQTRFGVWYAERRDGSTTYSTYWAMLSCPA